ncbi:MAG: hypothetical protein IKM94_04290, partial [Alphaproteobacteria bacterium]|nr:hypothetical protein [Alphaproteobacteria bacterium]
KQREARCGGGCFTVRFFTRPRLNECVASFRRPRRKGGVESGITALRRYDELGCFLLTNLENTI